MLLTRIKKFLSLKLAMLLACLTLLSVLSIASPKTPEASAESAWKSCATEATTCSFLGTKNVRYGATVNGVDQFVTEIKEAKSFTYAWGISCLTSEFGGFDPAPGKPKSCYVSDLTQDQIWSVSLSEGNDSIVIPFLVDFALAGTLEDLKNKILVKRTDVPGFTALGPEDTVGMTRTGEFYNGKSTLTIGLSKPLTGSDNELIIGAGAFLNYAQDIVINELKEKDAGNWQYLGEKRLSAGKVFQMSTAVLHGTSYLAYVDVGDNSLGNQLFVKKYNQGTWVETRVGALSAGAGYWPTLVVEGDNLYVCYMDSTNGGAAVKKYDESGNVWSTVGSGAISTGSVGALTMTVSAGIPYVAYRDGGNNDKLTVKKYNKDIDGWVTLGTEGFSDTAVTEISLSILDGIPYVAYRSESMEWIQYEGYLLTYTGGWVKKFDATSNSWTDMGKFTSSNQYNTLLFMEGGIPHVLYVDPRNGSVTMKKYTGSSWMPWVLAGNPDTSLKGTSSYDDSSFFLSDGILYMAYKQAGSIPAVKRFNGNNWISMGSLGNSQKQTMGSISLFVDKGVPYVAYSENMVFFDYKPGVQRFLLTSPALIADTTVNDMLSPIEVTFPEVSAWRNVITEVKDGTVVIPSTDYTIDAGKITFNPGALAQGDHTITVSAPRYADATVNQRVYFAPPALTADSTINDVVSAIEVTFPNDAAWRAAITAVKDGTTTLLPGKDYVVSAGKITFSPGRLTEGNHRITLSATDYLDTSVDQTVRWLYSPALTADTTDNDPSFEIDVEFVDDEAWRDGITAVMDGTKTLPFSKYSVSDGKITFKVGVLSLGAHTIKVLAENYADATVVQTVASKPQSAELSALSFSGGTLPFAAGTTSYTISVASYVENVTVTPTATDTGATVTVAVGGATSETVISGHPSSAIPLSVGENTLSVVVSAPDGVTTNTYWIRVVRVSDDALLSNLTVDQGALTFVPSELNYSIDLPNDATDLHFTVTLGNSDQTLAVTGATHNSVTDAVYAYGASNLAVGANLIQISVTAKDGLTMNPYRLTVNRSPASDDTDLKGLLLSSGTLSPSFTPGTTVYTSGVDYDISSLTVTASAEDDKATMTVNGAAATSGVASDPISLSVGPNPIEIVVTAEDGSVTTYTVTVTRNAQVNGGGGDSGVGGGSPTVPIIPPTTSDDGQLTLPKGTSGEVSLNNEVTVSIPADASAEELKVTIDKVLDTQRLLTDKEVLVSPVFEILKNFAANFDNPVTLTFTFDPAGLKNGETVAVFYYDETKKEWVKVGGVVNGNEIVVDVNHFTKYAVFAVNPTTEEPSAGTQLNFGDIAGHWAEASIKQAVNDGIVNGYADGTFRPGKTVTRAEFTVMLMNALKPQGEGAQLAFKDAANIRAWAKKAVALAVGAGIMKGYEDGSFRPDAGITRAEMAAMVANALGHSADAQATTDYSDDKVIPAWAKAGVAYAKQAGIAQGKGDNRFAPQDHASRAEAVTVILGMLEAMQQDAIANK